MSSDRQYMSKLAVLLILSLTLAGLGAASSHNPSQQTSQGSQGLFGIFSETLFSYVSDIIQNTQNEKNNSIEKDLNSEPVAPRQNEASQRSDGGVDSSENSSDIGVETEPIVPLEEESSPVSRNGAEREKENESHNESSPIEKQENKAVSEVNSEKEFDNSVEVDYDTCSSVNLHVVEKSVDSATIVQIMGEEPAGQIKVKWFYEDRNSVERSGFLEDSRDDIRLENSVNSGDLERLEVNEVDCVTEKSGSQGGSSKNQESDIGEEVEADTELTMEKKDENVEGNSDLTFEGEAENGSNTQGETTGEETDSNSESGTADSSQISLKFKEISVEDEKYSVPVFSVTGGGDPTNLMVKVSTSEDSAYGCLEEGNVCYGRKEVLNDWELTLDSRKSGPATITIEVYDHTEGESPLTSPGEKIDLNGNDPSSKSVSLAFSPDSPASPSLTVNGDGDNEGERDGKLEVEVKAER